MSSESLKNFHGHKEAGVGSQPVVGIRASPSRAVLFSFRTELLFSGRSDRQERAARPAYSLGGPLQLDSISPSFVIKIWSSGWGRGLALGMKSVMDIRAHKEQGGAGVTQAAAPNVGQPLAGKGRAEECLTVSLYLQLCRHHFSAAVR